jgi:hypothetical protein
MAAADWTQRLDEREPRDSNGAERDSLRRRSESDEEITERP